ncbi:MAG: glycosyltransferase [Pseudomonadota bacterium]
MTSAPTSQDRQCLILDPGLRVSSGHHQNAALHIVEDAKDAGFSVRVLASRFASDAVIEKLRAEPVFTNSAYSMGDGSTAAFDRYASTTFDALIAALGPDLTAPDVIVLPTADAALAEALARYLEMVPEDRRPGVIAWLLLPRDFLRMNTPAAQGGVLRGFHRLDAALPRDRFRVFVETEAVRASFAEDFSVEIEIAPSPSTALQPLTAEGREADQPLTFSGFGHIRPGKGFELFPEAIRIAKAARPDIVFRIHATPGRSEGAEADLVAAMAAAAPDVEVIARELDGPEYNALLGRADVALLPYDPAIYAERGSGIFNEFEQLGKPVVATAGCSFAARAIADGRAIAAQDYSPQALAAAIVEAADHFDDLSVRCRAFAEDRAAGGSSASLGDLLLASAPDVNAPRYKPEGTTMLYLRARLLHSLRVLARAREIRKARAHGRG